VHQLRGLVNLGLADAGVARLPSRFTGDDRLYGLPRGKGERRRGRSPPVTGIAAAVVAAAEADAKAAEEAAPSAAPAPASAGQGKAGGGGGGGGAWRHRRASSGSVGRGGGEGGANGGGAAVDRAARASAIEDQVAKYLSAEGQKAVKPKRNSIGRAVGGGEA
jgi:hypothetical protein